MVEWAITQICNISKANQGEVALSSMDDIKPEPDTGTDSNVERRKSHNLRVIFEAACQKTAPFFDPVQGWGDASLTMYARQTLRETYPELTQQETAILFSAVERFHKAGHNK